MKLIDKIYRRNNKKASEITYLITFLIIVLFITAFQPVFNYIDTSETNLKSEYNIYWKRGNITSKTNAQSKNDLIKQNRAENKYNYQVEDHQGAIAYLICASSYIFVMGWSINNHAKANLGVKSPR